MRLSSFLLSALVGGLLAATDIAEAQRPAGSSVADTAQRAYLAYRKALANASAMTDLKPYMTSAGYASAMSVPADKQPTMFATLKTMNASIVRLEVLDRAANRDTVVLRLRGFDRQTKGPITGAAIVVRERGTWRIGRESWGETR